jgi:hypothetical protein
VLIVAFGAEVGWLMLVLRLLIFTYSQNGTIAKAKL